MEPALQRLGDVTIQRLQKPKELKEEPPSKPESVEQPKAKEEHETSEELCPSDEESDEEFEGNEELDFESPVSKPQPALSSSTALKRSIISSGLNLGPEISFKKFKSDTKQPEKDITPTVGTKSFENESEPNLSEDEMSYYDSDMGSESELQDLGADLGLNLGLDDVLKNMETKPQHGRPTSTTVFPSKAEAEPVSAVENNSLSGSNVAIKFPLEQPMTVKEEDDQSSNGENTSFFENLVEQAVVPTPTSSDPNVKNEIIDEDYEIDIKEKLKEMGEITFASVKKGDKPKASDSPTENEVVITKKTGDEVTVVSKGNLRRNIREVMDETKLDETTLAAQRQEAERLKRVQEQQRILREYQRQAQQEKMQQKVISLLQGNNFSKPGPSNQTRIGNTVLVKLPNGQTKSMTKVPRFDLLKMPKPEAPYSRYPSQHTGQITPLGPMGVPRGYPRLPFNSRRGSGVNLPTSLSFSPVTKRGPPLLPPRAHQSDSDSESEDRKNIAFPHLKSPKLRRGKTSDNQTIEVSSDDDCIVVSESEGDQGPDDDDHDDPSNSGMHTNDEFNQPDEKGRVLINVGHSEDDPDVFIAPQIARIIKPHQIGGVRFLYDNIVETINGFDSSAGFGCILAHSMGLGKTLQIVTFSDVFLRYTAAKTILCIMPINTLQNWMAEYNMWTPTSQAASASPLNSHGEVRPRNFNLHVLNDGHKTLIARQKVIHSWRSQGGVLLIGYEQFRLLSLKKNPKPKRKGVVAPDIPETEKNQCIFEEIYAALVNPGPDLVICDEGHRIKNSHASISAALKQLRTKRRVVLTGYPLQNNLTEYWCMVDFVRPNYLGSKTEFLNMFERPIMNGQCIDSTEADIKLMRYRAHVLHSLLVGFVQRRSHRVLQTVLPQKEEYVLLVRLTTFQRQLYDRFMNEVVRTQAVPNPLKAFAVCCKIWNHPDVLYNFLMKRARGDAVDLDLDEVAGAISGASSITDAKAKRGPGKPRKTVGPRGRPCKPAASVTPYSNNADSIVSSMQPPTNINGLLPTNTQSQFNLANTTASFSNAAKSSDTNYGPYTDEFNQPRTSFEGISQFFDDHMSQPSYSAPFGEKMGNLSPFLNPDANELHAQVSISETSQHQNHNVHHNQTVKGMSMSSVGIGEASNSQQSSANHTSLFNLDNQNTVTLAKANAKSTPMIPNLPSGISLTPVSAKSQANLQNTKIQAVNAHPQNESLGLSLRQSCGTTGDSLPNQLGSNLPVQDSEVKNNILNGFVQQKNSQKEQEYHQQGASYTNNAHPNQVSSYNWLKKEDTSSLINSNNLTNHKSDSSNESKPKINIISDIKLPSVFSSDRKINIISDFKIESKKDEREDDKYGVKQELDKFKMEPKNELKIEDEAITLKTTENPLAKLVASLPIKDSKEDGGIPYDWILFCIIKESLALGDRLLVFSQSLITLDLIEQFLQTSIIPGQTCKWARNTSYYSMSDRVVDECNPDAHLTIKDVSTLCFDDKKDEGEIKDWSCCKDKYIDVVLQKVLDNHGTTLTKEPFQHESLLVDRKEKQLSQQEKRLAKKGYERDKNAARQPSYLSSSGRGHRPVASVRPMQQGGERPSRWIPAEHWQRQGMTAQEMTLPLDVVIPTHQADNDSIVIKAGQKVLVLKSPKGVYMQLESGKIVAIKTAIKVKGRADDSSMDPLKMASNPPFLSSQMKNNPLAGKSLKRVQKPTFQPVKSPFIPGLNKFNVKGTQKTTPNLVSRIQSISRKGQNIPIRQKPFELDADVRKAARVFGVPMPDSSESDITPISQVEKSALPNPLQADEGDELEKKITQLKKNISIQRVTSGGVKQPLKTPISSQPSPRLYPTAQQQKPGQKVPEQQPKLPAKTSLQDHVKLKQDESVLEHLGQSTSRLENTPFQETLDSITAGFKNPDNLDHLDSEDDEIRHPLDGDEPDDEASSDASLDQSKLVAAADQGERNENSDQSDEVTYVSEQFSESAEQQFTGQQVPLKSENSTDYNTAPGNYNYGYNYNMAPFQNHPPQQPSYNFPLQPPPPPFDGYSGYQHGQAPYNYGYQGYPPPQPHYPPLHPQPGYEYNSSAPVYPSYPAYPQQYPPPPQGIYPPPAPNTVNTSFPDYPQYPNQTQSTSTYYQNS
ncbi:hypothetical protein HUJ05_007724 [Dendroctonus ponderosae]|nr:hypothetical protein HUJ05_007724 [Dendroctonus ponderosae]